MATTLGIRRGRRSHRSTRLVVKALLAGRRVRAVISDGTTVGDAELMRTATVHTERSAAGTSVHESPPAPDAMDTLVELAAALATAFGRPLRVEVEQAEPSRGKGSRAAAGTISHPTDEHLGVALERYRR